ncbi:MAG: hypothetical protein AB8G26_03170 [Ilumatobacter sp.]
MAGTGADAATDASPSADASAGAGGAGSGSGRGRPGDSGEQDGLVDGDGSDGADDAFRLLLRGSAGDGRADIELLQLWYDVVRRPNVAALAAWARLSKDYLPWVERRLVHRARRDGMSWSAIGRLLGRSRQAVQQQHDRVMTPDELLPPSRRLGAAEQETREQRASLAEWKARQSFDDESTEGAVVPW